MKNEEIEKRTERKNNDQISEYLNAKTRGLGHERLQFEAGPYNESSCDTSAIRG